MDSISSAQLWAGRMLSGIAILFLFVDALGKLLKIAPVMEGTAKLGYQEGAVFPLGVLLIFVSVAHSSPTFCSAFMWPPLSGEAWRFATLGLWRSCSATEANLDASVCSAHEHCARRSRPQEEEREHRSDSLYPNSRGPRTFG